MNDATIEPGTYPLSHGPHLILVDDDHRLRMLIGRYFKRRSFQVTLAHGATDARQALDLFRFDAAILDINLEGESGLSLGREVSSRNLCPVLYLSALSEVDDRIAGLEAGGADYLTKPFEPRELELRINNMLANTSKSNQKSVQHIEIGSLRYDLSAQMLTEASGKAIRLSRNELRAIHVLAQSCPRPVSRAILAETMNSLSDRSIDTSMARLRRKLEADGNTSDVILTVRGEGFRLQGQRV